jgi:hypothetical protein
MRQNRVVYLESTSLGDGQNFTEEEVMTEARRRHDLITRLEAASEGSQELDEAIARYLSQVEYSWWRERPGPSNFTRSVDAALTLLPVPKQWTWQVSNRAPAPHKGRAFLHNLELRKVIEDTAATPELALCIAALKARAGSFIPDSPRSAPLASGRSRSYPSSSGFLGLVR